MQIKDPVCGMDVDSSTQYKSLFKGQVYFCSRECKRKFDASPEKYLSGYRESM
ncbi:MAG: YHS domain-containing protein [Thermocladium sp.]